MPSVPSLSVGVLGVIINPIAGMGGVVALHGTDGGAAVAAEVLGAERIAARRARRTLERIAAKVPGIRVLAPRGEMGSAVTTKVGLATDIVTEPASPTTAGDTAEAARAMIACGVELIVFAGGDGTAYDVAAVVGARVPVIGVPTGVKMHSGVFGTSPEATADAVVGYVGGHRATRERDVLELDVPSGGQPALHATVIVPDQPRLVQPAKATAGADDDSDLDGLAAVIVEEMEVGRPYIVGPGTTTARVMRTLGLSPSLRGVDLIRDRRLVVADATEAEILELLSTGGPATILLGVIGGQGYLLGRGNQPISPRVVARVGRDDIIVMAGATKLAGLHPPVLQVDVGIDEPMPVFQGYIRVRTAPGRSMIMAVGS
jgi:predicted polyphosphate/ATP-dependent NAD kinase